MFAKVIDFCKHLNSMVYIALYYWSLCMTNLLSFVDRIVPVSRFNRGEAIKIFNELAQTGAKIVMKNNAPVSIIMSP